MNKKKMTKNKTKNESRKKNPTEILGQKTKHSTV